MKEYIKFSSYIDDAYYYTQIDLKRELINVHKEKKLIYTGSIKEFKSLEKIKASNTYRVYESLLAMSEELISILSKG